MKEHSYHHQVKRVHNAIASAIAIEIRHRVDESIIAKIADAQHKADSAIADMKQLVSAIVQDLLR